MEPDKSLDLANPLNIVKLHKASEVLERLMDGETVEMACKQAGITPQTYRHWIDNGVFSTLTGAALSEMQQLANQKIVSKWGLMLERLSNIALGSEVAPRDSLAAIKMVYEMIIRPVEMAVPKGKAAEEEFLQQQGGFGWLPVLQGGKIVAAQQTVTQFQFEVPSEPPEVLDGELLDVLEGEEVEGDL